MQKQNNRIKGSGFWWKFFLVATILSGLAGLLYISDEFIFKKKILTAVITLKIPVYTIPIFLILLILSILVYIKLKAREESKIKSEKDVEKLHLNLLGIVPSLPREGIEVESEKSQEPFSEIKRGEESKVKQIELANHYYPAMSISEFYRTIRTSIMFSHLDRTNSVRNIVIISANRMEGRSSIIANLAVSFAEMGEKVLVVGTDLRNPRLHQIFKVKKSPGLNRFLRGKITLKEAFRKTSIKNIYLLPSGARFQDPLALLGGLWMFNLMEEVKAGGFDYIFYDTPPMLDVADASIVSSYADCAILVISAGLSNQKEIKRVLNILEQKRARILGVILNNAMIKEKDYPSYFFR
ncbi:MAG: CpsD/CapB family tyrosine-protein kinase [Candidatus Aminicenantes bacterium]|nr:MAG: CpsD/CapB family tyrosine-protein kinase [Candidatus Aminicenantes bacterium]